MRRDFDDVPIFDRAQGQIDSRKRSNWEGAQAEYYGSTDVKDMVLQLRRRARSANARANWVLAALLASTVLGLLYYIGLPIWQQLQDATKRAYETEALYVREDLAEMDTSRNQAWSALTERLALVGSPTGLPEEISAFARSVVLDDGKRVLGLAKLWEGAFSTNAGASWEDVSARGNSFEGELTDLRVAQDESAIIRFAKGETYERARTGDLKDKVGFNYLGYAWPPAVSNDLGATWALAAGPDLEGDITELIYLGDNRTILAGVGDALARSGDNGLNWELTGASVSHSDISFSSSFGEDWAIIVRKDNSMLLTDDKGMSWKEIKTGFEENIQALDLTLPENGGSILYVYLEDGATKISKNAGGNWRDARDGDDEGDLFLPVLVEQPEMVELPDGYDFKVKLENEEFFFGYLGAIANFDEDGSTVVPRAQLIGIESFDSEYVATDGEKTAILGAYDADGKLTFVGTADGGNNWGVLPTSLENFDPQNFVLLATDASRSAFLIMADEKPYVRFDDRFRAPLANITADSGSGGDLVLQQELLKLPSGLATDPVVNPAITRLRQATKGREDLEDDLRDLENQVEDIAGTGYSPSQRRRDFQEFLGECQKGDATATSCTDAYIKLETSFTKSIWNIVAERAPQAILLLFLLATLGGLYRYNLRLAGFHHSRADALELLAMDMAAKDLEQLVTLSESLAADKVEFGKGNSPVDQAVEMFKAVMARKA